MNDFYLLILSNTHGRRYPYNPVLGSTHLCAVDDDDAKTALISNMIKHWKCWNRFHVAGMVIGQLLCSYILWAEGYSIQSYGFFVLLTFYKLRSFSSFFLLDFCCCAAYCGDAYDLHTSLNCIIAHYIRVVVCASQKNDLYVRLYYKFKCKNDRHWNCKN